MVYALGGTSQARLSVRISGERQARRMYSLAQRRHIVTLVKNPPPAPGSLFLGVAIRSASGRDLTRVPKQISISGKPTSRSATRHF